MVPAYLVEFFDAQNTLNKSLQGKDLTVCEFMAKVKAVLEKLRLWKGNSCSGIFSVLSAVLKLLCQNPQFETTRFLELVTEHIVKLEKEIDGYFRSLREDKVAYLRNLFTAKAQTLQAETDMQVELIELQHDGCARDVYSERNLSDFWFTMCKSYKRIAEPAIQALLFPSTWLCESTFSMLRGIKSKYRSQLKTPEHDLCRAVANVLPRINELLAKKQAHPSH